jgi:hypothetical protein
MAGAADAGGGVIDLAGLRFGVGDECKSKLALTVLIFS